MTAPVTLPYGRLLTAEESRRGALSRAGRPLIEASLIYLLPEHDLRISLEDVDRLPVQVKERFRSGSWANAHCDLCTDIHLEILSVTRASLVLRLIKRGYVLGITGSCSDGRPRKRFDLAEVIFRLPRSNWSISGPDILAPLPPLERPTLCGLVTSSRFSAVTMPEPYEFSGIYSEGKVYRCGQEHNRHDGT